MLIYYLAVQPEQRISDPIQNDGETVILMALFIAMALAWHGAFMALAVRMAFVAMVQLAFTAMGVRMVFMAVACMAFMALAVRMAFWAREVRMAFVVLAVRMAVMPPAPHGQDISVERFIRVAATLLPIKS